MDEQTVGTSAEDTSLVSEPGVGLVDLVETDADHVGGGNNNVRGKEGSIEEWFWVNNDDSQIPGKGEPPVWYNQKTFKSVEEQAKAHPELRKLYNDKLKGLSGAPEGDYSYDFPEDFVEKGYEYDTSNPYYQDFLDLARNNGVSQELVEQMTDLVVESQNVSRETQTARAEESMNEEFNHLTNGDRHGFERAVKTAANNPNVDKEQLNILLENLTTADSIKAFTALLHEPDYARVPGPEVHAVRDGAARQNNLRERLAKLQTMRGQAKEDFKRALYRDYEEEYPGDQYFG